MYMIYSYKLYSIILTLFGVRLNKSFNLLTFHLDLIVKISENITEA